MERTDLNKVNAIDSLNAGNEMHEVFDEQCLTNVHDAERKSHHSDKLKKNLATRLNRIEGQVRGVKGMIERDTYCDDVLHQLAAIQSALHSVGRLLLENHMRSCVKERIEQGDDQVIDEVLNTMKKLLK